MAKRHTTRLPNLDALLAKWQTRLGLADWDIEAEYVKADERDIAGKYATIYPEMEHKRAWINVLHPGASAYGHIESTVVHELIHLHLYPFTSKFGDDSVEHLLEEQAVHALTRALIGDEYE